MCFSLAWLLNLLVWVVIIVAIIAILQIIVPWVLSKLGASGILGEAIGIISAVIKIIIWAIVIIAVLYVCFGLISCLLGYGGGGLSLFPHK
jgi:hypothetical protein